MKVESWSNRWLNRMYKTIAVLLVLVAVIISGIRLLLPYADNYRLFFQDYVNQSYNAQVKIGELTTGWEKFGPTLVAKNVSLFDSEAVKIFIEEIDVHIDFWQSIRERRLKTNDFTLSGAKIKLDKTVFAGDNASQLANNRADVTGISNLFLQQVERFTIRKSQLFVQDFHNKHRRFLIDQLAWQNSGTRHRAAGDVEVDGVTKNTLSLLMDLHGRDIADINGQIYLSGERINITPWLGRFTDVETAHANTDINFQSWVSIEQGHPRTMLVEVAASNISWQDENGEHSLAIEPGYIEWRHDPSRLEYWINSSPLQLVFDQQQWPTIRAEYYANQYVQTGYLSELDLALVAQLYPLVEIATDKQAQMAQLAPTGRVYDIFFRHTPQRAQMAMQFEALSWQPMQHIPGIANVDGELLLQDQHAQVQFVAENQALDFNGLFDRPVPFSQLQATADIAWQPDSWQVSVSEMMLTSDEVALNGEVTLVQAAQQPLTMGLAVKIDRLDARAAGHYYPQGIMSEELIAYLNDAIIDGEVDNGRVVINGPIAEFPFVQQQGRFIVDAELKNSTFKFSPEWPAINNFSANLLFSENSMLIKGNGGNLKDIDVAGVTASIPNLSDDPILYVASNISVHPLAITDLMLASPLRDTVGKVLQQVIVSGQVGGEFELLLPLDRPHNTVAKGRVLLADNDIDLISPNMTFTDVVGELRFNNEQIQADKLSFAWQGLPIKSRITGLNKQSGYQTTFNLAGDWSEERWQQHVPASLADTVAGELNWLGKLTLNNANDGAFDYQLTLNSALTELELKLPQPFSKPSNQDSALLVSVNGDLTRSTISAQLAEQANFYGELAHDSVHFTRAHLVLGNEQLFMPTQGFFISADLAAADFSDWRQFVSAIIDALPADNINENDQPLLAMPKRIRGTVGRAKIANDTLNQLSFDVQSMQDWWQVELNAQQLRAQAKLFHNWQEYGADINIDFIKLAPAEQVENEQTATSTRTEAKTTTMLFAEAEQLISTLVPIRFECLSCQYGKLDLGQVNFTISKPNQQLVKLVGFNARRGQTQLFFDGEWQLGNGYHQSKINGHYRAPDVENELRLLGFDSIVRDSGIEVKFDAMWPGSPVDFSLANVNGKLSSRLDDGYLADVSDKGVRLLSVLSLRSLVRKLTLDFRDIFSKGMFYEEIKGDFTLQAGKLYTENLSMDGTAGDLTMQGNTDLVAGLLDYRLSFTPNVTSSLPVIVAWMTANPVIGLAALAVDGVIQSAEVIAKINYELTGSIDDPQFKEVDRKSRDVSVGQSKPTEVVEQPPEPLDPTILQLQPNSDKQNNFEQN